jgi:hypothetical protein
MCALAQAPAKDYTHYHRLVIDAEEAIFLKNNPASGLKLFKQAFDEYPFSYVDDCIEAFQLALHFKQEVYAMQFIKKALDNGFELHLLNALDLGCVCNHLEDMKKRVCVHEEFIAKNKAQLEAYAVAQYPKFLKRIDKNLYERILKRHVKEQMFKNYIPALGAKNMREQDKEYEKVCDDNLRFIDSLAANKIYLGERNLGIYTHRLTRSLNLPFNTIDDYLKALLAIYHVPLNTYVPIHIEQDYFDKDMLYNILFHNRKSYATLSLYKDEAIKKGYLHPREYASLRYNYNRQNIPDSINLFLPPAQKPTIDIKTLNERRKRLLLPSYESDSAKHAFAHSHQLKFSFGFFGYSR